MNNPFSTARWIWSAERGDARYAVRRFRGIFDTAQVQTAICYITADSRYTLYLDGVLLGRGPARSDVRHYIYDTYTLDLTPGKHVLAALVLAYMGSESPIAEVHEEGAFLLTAQSPDGGILIQTGQKDGWRVQNDTAYRAIPNPMTSTAYYGIGSCEGLDGGLVPWGWQQTGFDDSRWDLPVTGVEAFLHETPTDLADNAGRWRLMARDIPALYDTPREFVEHAVFPLAVPANTRREVILNAGEYANGYPVLNLSGGAGAVIRIMYAEAMSKNGSKGVRDNRDGTDVIGFTDTYNPGGGAETYSPLHWRAFRFVKLIVETGAAPITIEKFSYTMTGYPWNRQARLAVENGPGELSAVMDVDFRTLQRCTVETFMDCPYYEQLQYVGDTRLQALLGFVTTGDTKLAARAVRQFDWSRIPDGLTQSRYPSRMEQIIPPFSLIWILMVEDLWRYAPDEISTVHDSLNGCRGVLEWFGKYIGDRGVLDGHMPWWNFVDWLDNWHHGVPECVAAGLPCATINLQYLAAIQSHARLRRGHGCAAEADFWDSQAEKLAAAIHGVFWNESRQLFREGPEDKWGFTQHAQAWGLITDAVPADAVNAVADSLHADDTLMQTGFYKTFYVVEALAKVGRLEHLWDKWLAPWVNGLALNFSTWPEKPEPTRSDCHAWSAWPSYALITHALGIRPSAPGFAEYEITPKRVAGWDKLTGQVPTPSGLLNISVAWKEDGTAEIETKPA